MLAFYFADQLRDLEAAGFGFSDFFADMIASFDPAGKLGGPVIMRPCARAQAARKAHPRYRQWLINPGAIEAEEANPRAAWDWSKAWARWRSCAS